MHVVGVAEQREDPYADSLALVVPSAAHSGVALPRSALAVEALLSSALGFTVALALGGAFSGSAEGRVLLVPAASGFPAPSAPLLVASDNAARLLQREGILDEVPRQRCTGGKTVIVAVGDGMG